MAVDNERLRATSPELEGYPSNQARKAAALLRLDPGADVGSGTAGTGPPLASRAGRPTGQPQNCVPKKPYGEDLRHGPPVGLRYALDDGLYRGLAVSRTVRRGVAPFPCEA